MSQVVVCFIVLGFVCNSKCDLTLQIYKKNNDVINPVRTSTVEEKVGTTFSLVCELTSTENDSIQFDDQLSWVKGNKDLASNRFPPDLNSFEKDNLIKEINKSEKRFGSLQSEDKGIYYCISFKFARQKSVEIVVRDDPRMPKEVRPMRETFFCANFMFKCVSHGVCIAKHYVCDGKQDCKDGSDESPERCGGNACRDKLPCDDGRCIPISWCCDKHHDPNCTVVSRPKCCQYLSDSYEEMELGLPSVPQQTQHSGARYLFISVCIVSILFSVVLLLLIVSRVIIFAKKTAMQQQRHQLCENIALRNQTNVNIIPCDIYTYRHSRTPRSSNIVRNIIIDSSDVNDPLLFNPARFNVINAASLFDQPPSYVDVLRNNRLVNEPPPPYRSSEMLDLTSDSRRGDSNRERS